MNWSKYNKLFISEKFGYMLYNSLTNSLIEIDEEGYLFLKSIEGKQNVIIEDENFKKSLTTMKVIVENDSDEFYGIKYATHLQRFETGMLELTLNPTLNCNFACPYCFEENKPAVYMTDEVEDVLIEFIKKQKEINRLHITWFGGEPLMAFDRMESITNKVKEIDIQYTSKIITNGFLLNDKIVDRLEEMNVSSIQITIDGLKEEHDKKRYLLNGAGTFETIVTNIDNLLVKNDKIYIGIRVNIDVNNADNYIKVVDYFYEKYKHLGQRISVHPGFLTNETGCIPTDCVFDSEKKAKFLMELYKKHGINAMGLFPLDFRYECPIRNPYHLTIGPEGEIYKCWNDVGKKEQVVGSLIESNMVNNKLLTRYYVAGDALEDKECIECVLLPRCGGGCPQYRIINEFESKKNDLCDFRKNYLQEFLELHYDLKQKTNKI
ncbi:MAG: radical SAM protein [Bacteroidales bacterium]|jgi:uncharacterized protein|nr:radical SAM protein [Bacteroidales bacterium]